MPDRDCPVNGVNCVSITRVEALERALETEKESRSRAHEKIFDRLGELERGMATVSTQYSNISDRLATISADLNAIIDSLKPITEYDLAGVEPTFHPIGGLSNVMREDAEEPGFAQGEALANAPAAQDGCFLVPSILGEGGDR